MTPEQASFYAQATLSAFENEIKTTRRVLAAVPDDKKDYKPGEASRSAKEVAWHIVLSEEWFLKSLLGGAFNWEGETIPGSGSIAELLTYYDQKVPSLLAQARRLSPEKLATPVDFFGMFKNPLAFYTNFLLVHSVHHRGQLSAYLRPMGAKVPNIYGGSADEPMQM